MLEAKIIKNKKKIMKSLSNLILNIKKNIRNWMKIIKN